MKIRRAVYQVLGCLLLGGASIGGGGGNSSNNRNGGILLAEARSAAVSSALSALSDLDYRYFVAGGTCAAISHGVTTPIDVVREGRKRARRSVVACRRVLIRIRRRLSPLFELSV